jgi:hypothetical protein
MNAQRTSAQAPAPHTRAKENARTTHESEEDAPVKPTPLLIVLGVITLLAGLVAGILMSQATLLR